MGDGTSFFEEKINSFDTALIELRNGSWSAGLTKVNIKKEFRTWKFPWEGDMLKPGTKKRERENFYQL